MRPLMTHKTALFLAVFLPSVVASQPTDSLNRAIDRFGTGSAIQVNETRGHFFGVRNGSLTLEVDRQAQQVPLSDIQTLWKQSSHAKAGALTGALIVGSAFAGIGSLLVGVSCENADTHCRGDYPVVAAYGFLIGGAGGGLVGGLIGYAVKKWVRVY